MMCTFTSILCTDQWHLHHTCPCYRLGLSSMYIKDSPMKKHTSAVFICQYMFSNFFPIILPWDWQIELKIIPTNVGLQFIWRCSHLAKLWVDASLWQELNLKPYTAYSMLYLKKNPYCSTYTVKISKQYWIQIKQLLSSVHTVDITIEQSVVWVKCHNRCEKIWIMPMFEGQLIKYLFDN